ncbi:transposase [Klebsiella pneumoniae]|uniref:transposase n=1 Tax=Klebsiella pneumoniae TaxID=573 RepID=UPI001D0DBEDC|nr:transposase [Klebsiella pneumoniae]
MTAGKQLAQEDERIRRLQEISGIGPVTASARSPQWVMQNSLRAGGRWQRLGLVPRQHSSGGKTKMGHISKGATATCERC